jgi:hypothetical protein
MKLKDMKPGYPYIVTTNGSTLRKGDHIGVDEWGRLYCAQSFGWLDKDDWKRLRNNVELDKKQIESEIEDLHKEIAKREKILKG